MYKLDLPVDYKEAAAIERRRRMEEERKSRIFNAKCRTIGVRFSPIDCLFQIHTLEVIFSHFTLQTFYHFKFMFSIRYTVCSYDIYMFFWESNWVYQKDGGDKISNVCSIVFCCHYCYKFYLQHMLPYFYNSIIRMIILMFHNTVNMYELYMSFK